MQLIVLGGFLVLQIAFILVGTRMSWIDLTARVPSEGLLLECVTVGLLGGTLSSAMFVNALDRSKSFQEVGHAWATSLARALIGCAASIPVYMIASAGLINIGGKDSGSLGILLPCFLAGFSERWFLHIIPGVSGKPEK